MQLAFCEPPPLPLPEGAPLPAAPKLCGGLLKVIGTPAAPEEAPGKPPEADIPEHWRPSFTTASESSAELSPDLKP